MADMKKEDKKEVVAPAKAESYSAAKTPTMSICVRKNELMADVKTGSYGRITIPVKVMDVGDGLVEFLKDGEAKVEGEFCDHEPLENMKGRIGVAEDR